MKRISVFAATMIWGGLLVALATTPASATDDFRDIPVIAQAVNKALETQKVGITSSWFNPDSGNSGKIIITQTYQDAGGRPCRNYRRTTKSGRVAKWTIEGVGCRKKNGLWELQEDASAIAKARRQKRASPLPPNFGSGIAGKKNPPVQTPLTFEEEMKLLNDFAALVLRGQYREALSIAKSLKYSKRSNPAYIFNLAGVYSVLGMYDQAAELYKEVLDICEKEQERTRRPYKGYKGFGCAGAVTGLAESYFDQGDHARAEALLKRSIEFTLNTWSEEQNQIASQVPTVAYERKLLGRIFQAQGRLKEAEAQYKSSLAIYERELKKTQYLGNINKQVYVRSYNIDAEKNLVSFAHLSIASVQNNLAELYQKQGRHAEAEALLKRSLISIRQKIGENTSEFAEGLVLLAEVNESVERKTEAEQLYKQALSMHENSFGKTHPKVAKILGNLSTLYRGQGRYKEALSNIRRATAIHRDRAARMGAQRSKAVLHEQKNARQIFLNHVQTAWAVAKRQPAKSAVLRAEAFEAAQLAQTSSAAMAVANMAARFAAGDDALARIVRARQDAIEERRQTDSALAELLSRQPNERNRSTEARLRGELEVLGRQIGEVDERLSREFPEYAEMATPRPVSVSKIKKLLGRNEALILFLIGTKNSFIWVVRRDRAKMTRLSITAADLEEAVFELRGSLDATGIQSLGDIPDYPLTKAYELYRKLLASADPLLKSARHVFVVPGGALQSLPLSVLVTDEPKGDFKDFSGYRQVPWLAKKYALTTLPSVSSLQALRRFAKRAVARVPFTGFGDPLLKGRPGGNRGIKLASLYRGAIADVDAVRDLPPLPDTADELRALSAAVNGDPKQLYLREKATEKRVKSMDLSNSRIVAFATHALVAGDLKNAEPALVLTPPKKGTALDDGLLTASEVAQLKLNADLVILSACNTAAGDDSEGAEGLSGLAKAFFYAGTRALLVSHWPVVSDAAVKLTTGMLRYRADNPTAGRAEALRRSMLALMNDKEKPHYAHPMFWAPFVVVGEGGTPVK